MADLEKEGVIKLDPNCNIYRVKSDLIQFTDGRELPGGVEFVNPRHLSAQNGSVAKGFSPEEMDELRISIQRTGLQHPLILFGRPTGLQHLFLLSGERRKRCIDRLRKENAECFNPVTGKFEPAQVLYEYLEARIYDQIEVADMWAHAFSINGTGIDIGEAPTVMVVEQFRKWNWAEEKIVKVTNRSITWVRDCFRILDLDPETKLAFLSGTLNRAVALQLSTESDVAKRQAKLALMKNLAEKRYGVAYDRAVQELESAEEELDLADAIESDAKSMGDTDAAQKAHDKKEAASQKVAAKKNKVGRLRTKKSTPKITTKVADQANAVIDGESGKPLTFAKFTKKWLPELHLAAKGEVPGVNPHDATLVIRIYQECAFKGADSPLKLLEEHNLQATK